MFSRNDLRKFLRSSTLPPLPSFPVTRPLARRSLLLVFAALPFLIAAAARSQSSTGIAVVTSPDGHLRLTFAVLRDGRPSAGAGDLVYSVNFDGKPLLVDSSLGLSLTGAPPLGEDVRIVQVTPGSGVDEYTEIAGKTDHVHDAYNSVQVRVEEPGEHGRTLIVEGRAYNGALAFRYVVPKQPAIRSYRLHNEDTDFNFSRDATSWALELPNFRSAYESEYVHPLHISSFGAQGGTPSHILIGLPFLTHVPGAGWLAITEADLHGNSVMYLTHGAASAYSGRAERYCMHSVLAPRFNNTPSYPTIAVAGGLPHHTAWRILQIADHPSDLIDSNIIDDLNPPPAFSDTSWIHAGKTAWNWWSGNIGPDGKPANTTATAKFFVDFAAQSHFRYMLIDAGWSKDNDIMQMNGDIDVPDVVQYAAARGVKIWIWVPYDAAILQMDKAFPRYEHWGVAGVKIDFLQRGDQPGIEFYYRAAQLAAEHHLMLDFHGTTTPWGISRTYPNVLGFEAVLGMEHSKVGDRDDPVHRTTLPFTRLLNGPMDYTPGGFDNATEAGFIARDVHPMVLGTRAQQLALYVIDFAPFQMVSDAPQAYASQPAFRFIRDVPAAWDETLALQGYPSETVTIARRSGHAWYVGSITNWKPRDIELPLNFLGDGQYSAEIYQDAPDADRYPQHVSIEKKNVQKDETLRLHLAAGGGCAIRFVPTS